MNQVFPKPEILMKKSLPCVCGTVGPPRGGPLVFLLISIFLLFLKSTPTIAQTLLPTYLRTEYKVNPVTDVPAPRLSWELTSPERNQIQTAYQILVASSPEKLTENGADLWNSGKVAGRATAQVPYAGKKLESRQIGYWKVRSLSLIHI